MRVSDVARECDVSVTQVYTYIADGELQAWNAARKGAKRRDYRIKREWFLAFYNKRIRGNEGK